MRRAILLVAALLAPLAVLTGPADAGSGCGLLARKAGVTYRTKAFHERPVAMYGDSITFEGWLLLAKRTPPPLAVNALSGRRTLSTVNALNRDVSVRVPEVVVMAVGTNDLASPDPLLREQVSRTRALLPTTTRLLWVNTYVETLNAWPVVNAMIASVPGVEVIDWAAVNLRARGTSDRSPLLSDKVHLSCAGGKAWSALIDSALRSPSRPVHDGQKPFRDVGERLRRVASR